MRQLNGALRASKYSQTGFSTNEMMLGREVIKILNIFLGTSDIHKEKDIHTYVIDLKTNLDRRGAVEVEHSPRMREIKV